MFTNSFIENFQEWPVHDSCFLDGLSSSTQLHHRLHDLGSEELSGHPARHQQARLLDEGVCVPDLQREALTEASPDRR